MTPETGAQIINQEMVDKALQILGAATTHEILFEIRKHYNVTRSDKEARATIGRILVDHDYTPLPEWKNGYTIWTSKSRS